MNSLKNEHWVGVRREPDRGGGGETKQILNKDRFGGSRKMQQNMGEVKRLVGDRVIRKCFTNVVGS
jgi:hypothetical protein